MSRIDYLLIAQDWLSRYKTQMLAGLASSARALTVEGAESFALTAAYYGYGLRLVKKMQSDLDSELRKAGYSEHGPTSGGAVVHSAGGDWISVECGAGFPGHNDSKAEDTET